MPAPYAANNNETLTLHGHTLNKDSDERLQPETITPVLESKPNATCLKLLELELNYDDLVALSTHLKTFSKITRLELPTCIFSDHLFFNPLINANDQNEYITSVSLSGSQNITENVIKALKTMPNLTSLDLSNTTDSNQKISFLQDLKNLTSLNLSGHKIDLQEINALKDLSHLTSLDISNCVITADALRYLIQSMPKLTSLNMSHSKISIGNAGADQTFAYLTASMPNLTSLDISHSNIGETGEVFGFLIRSLPNLSSLDISHTKLGDVGVKTLVEALEKKTSQDEEVKDEEKKSTLTSLNISHNNVSDNGAEHLSKLTALTTLNTSNNRISDDGAKHLAKLTTTLQQLDISDNRLDRDGIKALATSSAETTLTDLNISGNNLHDGSALALEGNCTLTTVRMNRTTAIMRSNKNKPLKHIDITATALGIFLSSSPRITTMTLERFKIPTEIAEELERRSKENQKILVAAEDEKQGQAEAPPKLVLMEEKIKEEARGETKRLLGIANQYSKTDDAWAAAPAMRNEIKELAIKLQTLIISHGETARAAIKTELDESQKSPEILNAILKALNIANINGVEKNGFNFFARRTAKGAIEQFVVGEADTTIQQQVREQLTTIYNIELLNKFDRSAGRFTAEETEAPAVTRTTPTQLEKLFRQDAGLVKSEIKKFQAEKSKNPADAQTLKSFSDHMISIEKKVKDTLSADAAAVEAPRKSS